MFLLTPLRVVQTALLRNSWWILCLALLPLFAAQAESKNAGTRIIVIDVDQAKRLYDLGAVFIDGPDDEQWRIGHIKNARHVNFRKNFARLKSMEGINKDTALVFYCSSAECEIGAYAAAVSMEWGFKNALYFQDGYFAWMLEDHPITMNSFSTYTGTIQIRRAPAAKH